MARIQRTYKDKTYVTYLLRRSYRDGDKVKHQTLSNLSHLPEHVIDLVRRSLQGESFCSTKDALRASRSLPHGHVQAILDAMRRLGIAELLSSKSCRERNIILALIVERLLFPCSKLATTRHWHSTTLAEELGVTDVKEKEVYQALDWLVNRQKVIENKLAERHLRERSLVLYDVSSSSYHGRTCPLATYGYNRDGHKGLPIIVYGLLTDRDGRPVAVTVYRGNTSDPTTVPDQVDKLRQRFGLRHVVLAGDRGMLTDTQIEHLKQHPGLGWISALRSNGIRTLIENGLVQRSLFDEVHLAEISSPDYPGERLVACYNPLLAEERRRKRETLLTKTEEKLTALAKYVSGRTKKPFAAAEIGLQAGKVVNKWKMAKHFRLRIADGVFRWWRKHQAIKQEQELDGIYVIRTSEPKRRLKAANAVRHYKCLSTVERAFRSLKGINILIRPIHHWLEPRVRAHVFLCMLAYYVEWHLRHAWQPLLFEDEELEENLRTRDPVDKPEPSDSVKAKKKTKHTPEGMIVHSLRTLLAELANRSRVTYTVAIPGQAEASFTQLTDPTPLQTEALRLLENIP